MAGKQAILENIRNHFRALREAEAAAKIYHQRYLEEINAAYEAETAATRAEQERLKAEAEAAFQGQIGQTRADVATATTDLGLVAAPWDSPLWAGYDPALRGRGQGSAHGVPGGARAGVLRVPNVDIGSVPASFP